MDMASVPLSRARANLTDLVNRVVYGGERIVLDRRGKREVAIISLADLELLQFIEDQLDAEAMRAALADAENAELIPHEQVKREVGL